MHTRATLHLITRWDELVQSNIDVRSFDDLTELFYCPSQTPLDCAPLKFTKETQRVRVELFTLDRDFATSELVNGLEKILPRQIDVQINPIDLFNVQDLALDKDHPHLFSFCCLLHTRIGTDPTKPKDIDDRAVIVFTELIEKNPFRSSSLSLSLSMYQHAMNLRNQAELYFAEEMNDTNQWQISVLQLWTLLKAFQNEFSLSMCQSIEDELRRTIQSLQIKTIGERLSWLTCLHNIPHSLVSKQLIERELNSTGPVFTSVAIGECALFLRTIEKSKMFLKLLVEFVLNNDSIDVNDC